MSGLKASFDAAMAAAQFGEAERLKDELAEARQELAVAEARVNGLRQAEAAIRAQQDEEARALQEAQRQALAGKVGAEARDAEQRAQDATEECLARMRASLLAARDAYLEAKRCEQRVLTARQRGREAQRMAGKIPAGHPGPVVIGPNRTRVLAESDPLIRELTRWKP